MKLSAQTISILKNFATINQGLVLKPGNIIRTIDVGTTNYAVAKIQETIPAQAAIYDLSRFLGSLSLFDDPEIEFEDKRFVISSGKTKISYTYASENMIVAPPKKMEDNGIKFPSVDATFKLTWKELEAVIRASNVLRVPDLLFSSSNGELTLTATDVKNPTSDNYSIVADTAGAKLEDFNIVLKTENLKVLPLDYQIDVCVAGIVKFESTNITYYLPSGVQK
jgi:hypothetical protein